MIDYQKLYSLQDQFFTALSESLTGFYLTGGTALSRFYLHHRYSDDLDFFINYTDEYSKRINKIFHIIKRSFTIDETLTLEAETYTRFWIVKPLPLKLDFVNEVPEQWAGFNQYMGINIDNPANILSNKLGAIISRDEPKDVFDIVTIAEEFSFNWVDVFKHTVKKQIVNETDVAMRLDTFPLDWFEDKQWLKDPVNKVSFGEKLKTVVDDFIMGKDNSLGTDKPSILDHPLKP